MKQAIRIQTSLFNSTEKKILVWLANRQPRWVTSDLLTAIGVFGAFLVGLGFALSNYSIQWLWLSSAGLLVNWYGDSLDGTLARVRNCQRPIYGYYLDHTVDLINEAFMFVGAGLSPFLHLDFALTAYALYLILTITVSINAHLKSEFRLTYIKLGPTEFRIAIILANTLLLAMPKLATYAHIYTIGSLSIDMHVLDYVAVVIILLLAIIFLVTMFTDVAKYSAMDPKKPYNP